MVPVLGVTMSKFCAQEHERVVPVRGNGEYGRHIHNELEKPNRKYTKVDRSKKFFRANNTNLPTSNSEKCKAIHDTVDVTKR